MTRIVRIILLASILSLITSSICAQDEGQDLFQVLDSNSQEPIVYATVILKNSKIATITDENGNFRIPKIYSLQKDTLRISCIGYQTKYFPLFSMNNSAVNILQLAVKLESLEEVKLTYQKKEKQWSARKIVKKAIKSIPDNYSTHAFSYICYYRDYQRVTDSAYLSKKNLTTSGQYINLNEGLIEVFDKGFAVNNWKNAANNGVLYEFKRNDKFPSDSLLTIPYDNEKRKLVEGVIIRPFGGNEWNLLNDQNAIRNYEEISFSFVHIFKTHFTDNHLFTVDKITYLDDLPLYKIDFISNRERIRPPYKAIGSIYISKEGFGIHKLDYKLYNSRENKLLYRVNMEYKKLNTRYYLNYITFNNYFQVKRNEYFKVDKFLYDYQEASFHIFFNESIDPNSIENMKKKMNLTLQNKKLEILEVVQIEPSVLKIKTESVKDIEKAISNDELRYEIKKIKDIQGRTINEPEVLEVDQFREAFVQQVFPGKESNSDLEFLNKELPLKKSKVHPYQGKETYWINSPLKAEK